MFEAVVMKDISCGSILYKERIFVANLQNHLSKLKVLGSVDDGDPVGERKGIIPGFGCTGGLCIEKSRHCTDSAHQVDLRRCHLHAVTALAVNMLPGTTCELLIFG